MAVMDMNRSRLVLFSVQTGKFLSEIEVPFRHVGPNGATEGGIVTLAPAMSLEPLARLQLDSDSVSVFGEPLESGVEGWQTVSASSGVPAVAQLDTLLLVWYPALGLKAYRTDGAFIGNINVPAMRRRGEGDSLVRIQRDLRRERSDSVVISTVLGMTRLPNGEILLVSQDADRVSQNGRNARETNIRLFVTIIDAALSRACVDGRVPFETEVASLPIFDGNTVSLLSRRVVDAGNVRNVLYTYEVDQSSCEWVPIPDWRQ
jgi:hypothetical protein